MTRTVQTPAEYWFEERCHITEWWNTPTDAAVSVARARVEPGVTTRLHRLKGVTERYVILEGTGCAEVAGVFRGRYPHFSTNGCTGPGRATLECKGWRRIPTFATTLVIARPADESRQ